MRKRRTKSQQDSPSVVAYLRVSTVLQDLDSQRVGILDFIKRENLGAVDFIEERISSREPLEKRKISALVDEMQKDDVLVISEISRLGRNMIEIMTLLQKFIDKGIKVFSVKEGFRLDDSLNSKILSMVLAMTAEISRQLSSQRIAEGLAKAKQKGTKLGRPKGSGGYSKLDPHEEKIRELARKGVSKSSLAKMYDCSWGTMSEFCKRHDIKVNF